MINITKIQDIKISPNIEKIFKNIGWLSFDKILRLIVGFFVTIWLARYLGPKDFGVLNYCIAFVALFTPFVALGLNGIAIKELVKNEKNKEEILVTSFVLKFIGSILGLLLIFLLVNLFPNSTESRIFISIIAFGFVFRSFDVFDLWFQSKVLSKYTVIAKNTAFLISSSVKIILIVVKAPLITFFWAIFLEYFLSAILLTLIFHIKTKQKLFLFSFNIKKAKEMLNQSWPLLISSFGILIYLKIDQVMLGIISGENEVGIYSVAARITEMFAFLPVIIGVSFFPDLIKLKDKNEKKFDQNTQRLFNSLTTLAIVLAVVLSLSSSTLIPFLFGNSYAKSSLILNIYVWALVFIFFRPILNRWLFIENLLKFSIVVHLSGAFLNILLNLLLIPKFAGIGAAIATLISYASIIIVCLFYSKARKVGQMMIMSILFPLKFIFNKKN